jgi:hypothetical protein
MASFHQVTTSLWAARSTNATSTSRSGACAEFSSAKDWRLKPDWSLYLQCSQYQSDIGSWICCLLLLVLWWCRFKTGSGSAEASLDQVRELQGPEHVPNSACAKFWWSCCQPEWGPPSSDESTARSDVSFLCSDKLGSAATNWRWMDPCAPLGHGGRCLPRRRGRAVRP